MPDAISYPDYRMRRKALLDYRDEFHPSGLSPLAYLLLLEIEMHADWNAQYALDFYRWLCNGSTLELRDILAAPFAIDKSVQGKLDHFNAWACLDSIGMHSRDAIKEAANAA